MDAPKLEFLENQAGEIEGLGHAGIETYRDTPFTSCAREAGQNSLDAADGKPVQLEFRKHLISAKDIPGIGTLRETIAQCLKAARQGGGEKDEDFFENARSVVAQEAIDVLEISDFNTTGLEGPPNEPGSRFHSLVKSSGKSNKPSDTSGGSFGIGKNASFAVSDLRTVFYSTVYLADGQERTAVQGKVQLVSHTDAEGTDRTAKGYWGHPDHFTAVEDPTLVPVWLQRKEKGTSVFSIGFRAQEDWVDRMAVPLLSNFFCAVDDGEIVFIVGDQEHVIDTDTLPGLLTDANISAAAEESSHSDDLRLARQLYECRKTADAVQVSFEIENLGAFSARILVQEGMPKRVAIVRNGMLITQSLEYFGDKFARFPGARDFIVLVEPANKSASKTLKSLENPQHNAFSAGRLDDPAKQRKVQKAMKALIRQIRAIIKENAEIAGGDAVRLDELGEFFADAGTAESKVPSEEKDPETIVFTPARRIRSKGPKPVSPSAEGDEGGAGHDDGAGGAGTDGSGGGEGHGDSGKGTRGQQPILPLNLIRNVGGGPRTRKVFFTPGDAGPMELTFLATGIYDASSLRVVSASGRDDCTARGGKLILNADAGERVSIEVTFDQEYGGPIEVFAVRSNEL